MNNIYTKIFGEDEIKIRNKYNKINSYGFRPSSYIPNETYLLLRNIPQNSYILGPLYGGKYGNDFQLVVTGKPFLNETYEKAMYRELGEELCILPIMNKNEKYKFEERTNINQGKYKKSIASIKINNTKFITNERVPYKGKDDKKRKIIVLVYGSKNDILEKMENLDQNGWGKSDNIKGVVALSVSTAFKILSKTS